jgi:hypothetical protein
MCVQLTMCALILLMLVECALRHAHHAALALLSEEALLRMLDQVAILVTDREVRIASLIHALDLVSVYLTADLQIDRASEVRVGGLQQRGSEEHPPHAEKKSVNR